MSDQLPKFHSLTGRIDLDRMRRAFLAVKRNRGAAGVDKVSIRAFEANLDDNLAALMFDLKRGRYRAIPLRRVFIPKGEGKLRPLGIPTVRDRVAQEVVRSILEPFFEPHFSEFSFGFRPRRNAHQAIEALRSAHADGSWMLTSKPSSTTSPMTSFSIASPSASLTGTSCASSVNFSRLA